jgi:hypothetical protein
MKKLFTIIILAASLNASSQVSINNQNAAPHSSAMLDISSDNRGLLIPRMTDSAKQAISSPATGLMIYQTNNNAGFYYFNGSAWTPVTSGVGNSGGTTNWNIGNNRLHNGSDRNGLTLDSSGGLSLRTTVHSNTPTVRNVFNIDSAGSMVLTGALGYGKDISLGAGTRVIWNTFRAGFRAGSVDADQWNDANFGFYSTALGFNTTASAIGTTALGYQVSATGIHSTAIGMNATASGTVASAFGYLSKAQGLASTTLGYRTIANGYASTVVGINNDTLVAPQESGSLTTPLFMVGNGVSHFDRANALVVQRNGHVYIDPSNKNNGSPSNGHMLLFGTANGTGEGIASKRTLGGNRYGLDFFTNNVARMSISNGGYVGIGTTTPTAKLDIIGGNWDLTNTNGDIKLGDDTYKLKVGIATGGGGAGGVGIIQSGATGGNNVLTLGAQGTGILHVNGNNKTVGIGTTAANFPLTFANELGNKLALWSSTATQYYGMGIQNNLFQIFTDFGGSDIAFGYGSSAAFTETMRIKGNGNVGIGTTNVSHKLTVAGNICATGSIGSCSDIRYKTNIVPMTQSLSRILSIQGIYYDWKKDEYKDKGFTDERQLGFSAQEVEKLFPEIVKTDAEGYKTVDYSRMTPVLVEAVKEQQKQIDELKAQNKQLLESFNELKHLLKNKN